ncbi:threonine-rich protein [Drosophila mauritiana]|uniref:Threonine-rich protein n=1 Tax=Drosophila mauritiana TaxID=7226 RepID=A0A6P8JD40_DROMA|nr:threonine-rich protein [Drosophila mauritiana]
MKFAVALCLLLATSGFALVPKHPADLVSMLAHQQFAVRTLMGAPEARDESNLVNDCFNHYMEDQTNVILSYNLQYTGCLRTAQTGREELTKESASEREALLDRTNKMCSSLTQCDTYVDGLDFFDCYRNASSDSYKVMFTLNSDSSLDFNRISAKYQVIETDLTDCVDSARVDYAHDMDACDENLTLCLKGGETSPQPTVPTTTSGAPSTTTTTEAPVSTTPVVPSTTPVSTTPVAPSTTTTTEAPVSTTPVAPSTTPVSTTPVVPSTTTTTEAPVSTTPVAPSTTPVSTTPVAPSTTTTTEAPVSTTPVAPSTTPVSTTPVAPSTTTTTEAPVSTTPVAPSTTTTTEAPVSTTPVAPSTTTTTEAPVSTTPVAPSTTTTTEAPVSSTPESTTEAASTSERSPEEDINRSVRLIQRRPWNLFKRFF